MKKLILSCVALSTGLIAGAHAQTTSSEFSAINKIASLCQSCKASGIEVAIIKGTGNDASNIQSLAQAAGLKNSIITTADMESSTANLIFVASDVTDADQDKVKQQFTGKPVITVSTNLSCVESGKCLIGVDIGSVVKLLVNNQQYEASGLKFDPAFEFMVKQI